MLTSKYVGIIIVSLCLPQFVFGQPRLPDADNILRQRAEREQAFQRAQQPSANVHLQVDSGDAGGGLLTISDETPCFVIKKIKLNVYEGSKGLKIENFDWSLNAVNAPKDNIINRCLGTQGISIVMQRIQNRIIEKGYITTRIVAEPQDLTTGILELIVIPGRLNAVVLTERAKNKIIPFTLIPSRPNKLLNLRDIEQGLENLQRVPTASSDIQIVPTDDPQLDYGTSNLLVNWEQKRKFRLGITTDDTGNNETGKNQGGITLSIDNPFKMNDLFYANYNHDLGGGKADVFRKKTRGYSFHYSIPYRYWVLSLNTNGFHYNQGIKGAYENYLYRGESKTSEVTLSRIIHRNQVSKTSVMVGGWVRSSRNFIDDTEIEIQRRRMAGWIFGLSHQRQIKNFTIEGNLTYKRGTGAFNAIRAPEEDFDEGTSRFKLIKAHVNWQLPFSIRNQHFRYIGSFDAQWNKSRLTPMDFYSIGGRYSVRGFDGKITMSAERGQVLRNEIGYVLGKTGQELYLGIDVGHISGPNSAYYSSQTLVGSALGVRGYFKGLSYDGFIGFSLKKPMEIKSRNPTLGFSLSYQF